MPGKEISKLIPVKVMDKRGFITTVYVKPGDLNLKELNINKYPGDPEYKEGEDKVKDKFYPQLADFLGPQYSFKLHTNKVKVEGRMQFDIYKIPLDLKYKNIRMKASLEFTSTPENEVNLPKFRRIVFPYDSNVRDKKFFNKHIDFEKLDKLVVEEFKMEKLPWELYDDIISYRNWNINDPEMKEKFHKYFTNILK